VLQPLQFSLAPIVCIFPAVRSPEKGENQYSIFVSNAGLHATDTPFPTRFEREFAATRALQPKDGLEDVILAPAVQGHEIHFLTNTTGWKDQDEGHRSATSLAPETTAVVDPSASPIHSQTPVPTLQYSTSPSVPDASQGNAEDDSPVLSDAADGMAAVAAAAASITTAGAELFKSQMAVISTSKPISDFTLFCIVACN
jgi:hypothetical protein